MAKVAEEAGVIIVAGDTKVVEGRGKGQGNGSWDFAQDDRGVQDDGGVRTDSGSLIINTTGIGFPRVGGGTDSGGVGDGDSRLTSAAGAKPGDVIIVSGNLGDHHACILSARMNIQNGIKSDCGLLSPIADALYSAGVDVHVMRDVTRGGLATILNEVASSSDVSIELSEESIPASGEVKAFCSIMGLDPIYMGNEGKMIAVVPEADAEAAVAAMRGTEIGAGAAIIGRVMSGRDSRLRGNDIGVQVNDVEARGHDTGVTMRTRVGGTRRIDMLYGEGLPRIC
jgi:hydrogenase expression/formation protein HypE